MTVKYCPTLNKRASPRLHECCNLCRNFPIFHYYWFVKLMTRRKDDLQQNNALSLCSIMPHHYTDTPTKGVTKFTILQSFPAHYYFIPSLSVWWPVAVQKIINRTSVFLLYRQNDHALTPWFMKNAFMLFSNLFSVCLLPMNRERDF